MRRWRGLRLRRGAFFTGAAPGPVPAVPPPRVMRQAGPLRAPARLLPSRRRTWGPPLLPQPPAVLSPRTVRASAAAASRGLRIPRGRTWGPAWPQAAQGQPWPGFAQPARRAARGLRIPRGRQWPFLPVPPPGPAVAGTWSGSYAITSGFYFPYPGARPVQVPITNTAGDWLFALVAWRPSTAGADVSVCVADDARNWWEPAGAPAADSPPGALRVSVWAAPAARVANPVTGKTIVQVAATGPVLSLAAVIVDMSGLLPWYQVAAITGNYAPAASSLSLSAGAPPASALEFAVFGGNDNSHALSWPAGWTALPGSSASNGVDHAADVAVIPAYRVTGSASTAGTTSSGGTQDLAGVIAGVLVSAPQPAQPNPYWPVMVTEAAIGAGVQTPPSEMTWTQLGGRALALQVRQGRSYSLGALQAGQGTLTLDDPDGALIPPGSGAYAGIDSGTPLRRRVTWPGLPGSPAVSPHYTAFSGYLRRWPWNMDQQLLRGQVQAEVTDTWGYAAGSLNSMAVEECLTDVPHGLWPATDPAGSAGASNLAPGNSLPLTQVTSKYGAGGATAAFGANSGQLAGASGAQVSGSGQPGGSGMWQQALAGTSLGGNGYGYCLQVTDQAMPPLAGGVTVEVQADTVVTWLTSGVSTTVTASGSVFAFSQAIPSGAAVVFTVASGFTFPTGITAGQTYYVIGSGGTSGVQVSATPGGAAVTITANGFAFCAVILPWDPVIFSARDGQGGVFGLSVRGSDGALLLTHRAGTTLAATVVDSGHDYRHVNRYYSLSVTQATWRVLVGAGGQGTFSGTFATPLPASFRTLCVGGVQDATEQGYAMPGSFGFAGVYPGASPQVRVINRYTAIVFGLAGEAACDRVERILEYAGLAGRRWLGQQVIPYEGDLCVSGQDIGGQSAASSAGNVAQSTLPASLYVAPTGDITYQSKLYTWNQPVRWVLGTDTAAGEIPFAASVATDYDPTRVAEDVQLAQLDTQAVTVPAGVMSATTMAAVTAATASRYGGQPYRAAGYLEFDYSSAYTAGGGLQDLANWLANAYSKPQNRVPAVTVDAARHPAAWPFWAGASPGDMVQVNIRVPTAATSPLISLTARITQTDRSSRFSQDGTSATITCALDFAPEAQVLTCDDPVFGLLNGVNRLGW